MLLDYSVSAEWAEEKGSYIFQADASSIMCNCSSCVGFFVVCCFLGFFLTSLVYSVVVAIVVLMTWKMCRVFCTLKFWFASLAISQLAQNVRDVIADGPALGK